MIDDKGDNIEESVDEVVTTAQLEVSPSDAAADAETAQPEVGTADNKLSGLMADADAPAAPGAKPTSSGGPSPTSSGKPSKPAVDLEAEAMRAAEHAVAEGEKALADANAQLQRDSAAPVVAKPSSRKSRELVLRVLLAVNVLAMVVVSLLPAPATTSNVGKTPVVEPKSITGTAPRQMSEPFNRAMQAAENGDFLGATAILDRYLDDNPRMHAAERLSVLTALQHYASRTNDYAKSRKYAQMAQSLEQSHHLPEDLVQMAEAAIASGDQESLRRVWARFLLQQRQIPTWLYQHVAQAYLELGDSYRKDADAGAEQARLKELNEAAARLRAAAMQQGSPR